MPVNRGRPRNPEPKPGGYQNFQCFHCHKMLTGKHKRKKIGRLVKYQDNKGTYATDEEFRAAGGEPERVHVYGGEIKDPDYEHEHAVGHLTCVDCAPHVDAEWHRQMDERRMELERQRADRERQEQQEQQEGEGGTGTEGPAQE